MAWSVTLHASCFTRMLKLNQRAGSRSATPNGTYATIFHTPVSPTTHPCIYQGIHGRSFADDAHLLQTLQQHPPACSINLCHHRTWDHLGHSVLLHSTKHRRKMEKLVRKEIYVKICVFSCIYAGAYTHLTSMLAGSVC